MPIRDLQMRIRELGRIRIGDTQPTQSGRTRPSKLTKFRITSASKPLLEKVAQLYGGEVRDWTPQNSNLAQFEVYTDADRLPVLVPPNSVSQWYEHWSGGGCQRRCDGLREMLKDQPCVCGPDPADRLCKPTTRVNVMLREVEGIGVWRLESHGFNAAVELPQAAEFLARAGGYVEGFLTLAERSVVRDGKTSRFSVPALDIGITAGQLLQSGGAPAQLGGGSAPQLPAGDPAPQQQERQQLPAGKAVLSEREQNVVIEQIKSVTNGDQLSAFARELAGQYEIDPDGPIRTAFWTRGRELEAAEQAPPDPPKEMPVDTGTGASAGDPDAAWVEIMRAVPEEWSTTQVENDFEAFAGTSVEAATAKQMREYLVALPQRAKAAV